MKIGEKIKERRKELKWSQRELAAKMGYNHSTITRIENGKIDIPQSRIAQFAEVLNTTVAYLMSWEEVQQKNSALVDITIRARTDKEFFSIVNGLNQLNADQLASVKQIVELLLKG